MRTKFVIPIFTETDLGVMLTALEAFRDTANHIAKCPHCGKAAGPDGVELAKRDAVEAQAAIDALLIAVQENKI